MPEKKPFGSDKYAVAMAASLLVIIGGMMTTIVLAVAAGNDPVWSVISTIALFSLISLIPLRAMRPERSPQFPRMKQRESLWTLFRQMFEREEKTVTPVRPWKRKKTDFIPQPHGSDYVEYNCFVPERPEKDENAGT